MATADQTVIGDGLPPSRRLWTGSGSGRRGRRDETWEDVRASCGELKSGRGAGVGAVADASVGGRARSTLLANKPVRVAADTPTTMRWFCLRLGWPSRT
jgi:hypothetical protein